MATTIRTDDVRELLALVPFKLGFHPTESAVLVSLRGARSEVGLVARLDLADLADEDGEVAARAFVGHVVDDGARRAMAVIYTEADLRPPVRDAARSDRTDRDALLATHRLGAAAREAFGDAGTGTWVVTPAGYYALGCEDPVCCPPGGRPLRDLQSTQVWAQMVLEGVVVASSRDDLVRLPVVTPAQRRSARRARDRWRARGATASPGAQMHRWRREGLDLWRRALAAAGTDGVGAGTGRALPETLGERVLAPVAFGPGSGGLPVPTDVGRLLAALDDVLVRDAVLLTFIEGNDRVADRVVAGETGPAIGAALGAVTDPAHGRRPDPERTAAARAVLEHLVAHASRGMHAPALTLLAFLAWWEGDGARAGVLVDRALLADPDHRLAVLVDQALRAGMPPGWVRACRAV